MSNIKNNDNVNDLRLSVSESAKLFGIDQITIRRAIKSNAIRYIVVRNRYKISFESLLKWSQSRTSVHNKLGSKGIGQFVEKWKIKNTLYSPRPENKSSKKKTN